MTLTEPGMVTFVSPVQPSKAEPPIETLPYARLMLVSPVQSSKAELPIDVTLPGIDKELMILH